MPRKRKRRLRIPNNMRDMADIDYLHKLSPEERKFMMDFVDAEYCNNHRKYPMYTEHPEYDRIKKEIYTRTNAVNTRCDYAKSMGRNRLDFFDRYVVEKDSLSLLEKVMNSVIDIKEDEDMLAKLGVKSLEDAIEELVEETVHDIKSDVKDPTRTLVRFYIKLKKVFSEYRKQERTDRQLERKKSSTT